MVDVLSTELGCIKKNPELADSGLGYDKVEQKLFCH